MNARPRLMTPRLTGALGGTAMIGLLLACSGPEPASQAEDFLPERYSASGLTRISDVRTFVGDSLWEYINGDAEIYHAYRFEQVETGDYASAEGEIVIDIYRFADPVSAYGLYTAIRPEGPELNIGTCGFASESSLDFIRGPYLARFTSFAASPGLTDLLQTVAREVAARLPGTTERPDAFRAFPAEGRLAATDRYYTVSFLGYAFLTDVYTQSYAIDDDTLVLFMSETGAEAKLAAWKGAMDLPQESATHPFPDHDAVWLPDSYNGPVIAGRIGDRLAGVVNYSARHRDFAAHWLAVTDD